MRRLEGQHLLVFLQRGFDLNQWRARTRGDDQLGGLIINDAAMRRDVQHVTLHRTTEEGLRIATGDAQRRLARARFARLPRVLAFTFILLFSHPLPLPPPPPSPHPPPPFPVTPGPPARGLL